jgi:hypothetical protein
MEALVFLIVVIACLVISWVAIEQIPNIEVKLMKLLKVLACLIALLVIIHRFF